MNVLVSPSAYTLTDYAPTSEGLTAYNIMRNMQKEVFFHSVAFRIMIREPLESAKLYQIGSSRGGILLERPFTQKVVGLHYAICNYLVSRKILQKEKIDIVHHMFPSTSGISFNFLPLLPGVGKHYPFVFGPVLSPLASHKVNVATVKLTSKLHVKTVKKCDSLIVSTSNLKEQYSRDLGANRIRVIPLGVDTEYFAPSKETENKNNSCEILTVCFLTKRKGVDFLIEAMPSILRECQNAKLRIIGDGLEKGNLISLARKLGITKHVTLECLVSHSKLLEFYRNASIFCLPSLNEPFGKVIIEAMACGKPVVATKVSGPAEIIEDGKDGILASPADSKFLAEAIIQLLNDDRMRREIGRNARRKAVKTYSWKKVAQKYYQVYKDTLEEYGHTT